MSSETDLLVRIASLYYQQGINQNEIAEILNIERSRISRLLLQARNQGLVQFHVVNPSHRDSALNDQLQQAFGLEQAVVFDTLSIPDHQLKKTIGLIAAEYLSSVLKDGDVLAISWGETIYHMVQGLSPELPRSVIVVPSVGGSGLISPAYQVNDIARQTASKLGGFHRTLYAPAFLETPASRAAILSSKDIQAIVEIWKTATVALVGIGKSPFHYRSQPGEELQFGQFYLYPHEHQELRQKGVAGDINARFFGVDGKELDVSIHQRTIGMTLADLQRVPKVIGVAGGAGKVEAIASALLGRHLDVLITDSLTAEKLLVRQASAHALNVPQTV